MSRYKLEEVDYRITGYSPRFKIIDNEIEIEDMEREDGSIAYLHGIDEDAAKSIVEALEKQVLMRNTKNNKVSELNKAIFTLLYDQYDCPDMRITDSDETFVEYIAYALSKKNGYTCPFKNYDCQHICNEHTTNCDGDELTIDCGREREGVWREFINKACE